MLGASANDLREILGIEEPRERDVATAATTVMAVAAGAHIVRVHRSVSIARRLFLPAPSS